MSTTKVSANDRCEWSDLPVYECDHCPAEARQAAEDALRDANRGSMGRNATDVISRPENVVSRSGRDLWPTLPPTVSDQSKLILSRQPTPGTCACGLPLHDNATGCDECIGEMERILGDTPWLAEQLDLAITGQRAKRPGAGRGDDGLPWNDRAAEALGEFRNELVTTVRILVENHGLDWPDDSIEAMSRWLMCHVRLLAHDDAWTDALRSLCRIEGDILRIIDNPPALLFLGWCEAETITGSDLTLRIEKCDGPVYARVGQTEGRCRQCRKEYDVEASRAALVELLDDQLVTASEIAKLVTYLGIEQPRERVRNLVNSWARRKRIEARGQRDGVATFRWGDVAPMLSAAYETREERDV